MIVLKWVYLRLACTCEETCLSVWPPNASLYTGSTSRYLRILASPFGQGSRKPAWPTYSSKFPLRPPAFLSIYMLLGSSTDAPGWVKTEARPKVSYQTLITLPGRPNS